MIKKLRKKFITISTVAVASVMLLLFLTVNIANYISVNSKLNNTIDMIIANRGNMPQFEMREPPEGEMRRPDNNRFAREFNEETPFSTRFFVICFTDDGTVSKYDLEKIAAVTEDDVQKYVEIALSHGEGYGITDGYKYKVEKQSDGSFMAVFLDNYKEMNSARTILMVSALATVLCIALICVIIVLFSKKAMDPVIKSNQKQKQFITDASHELKTPITVISASLSVLEMEVGKQKWIDKAKGQTEKLTDLVNSLVTLSKMDEETPLTMRDFDISASVAETAESFSDYASSQGNNLRISVAENLTYHGDEYAVRQLTSILIDNAIKYAPDGTDIDFSLEKGKKGVIIRSRNECENIDRDELDKLFDRFYRADKARSGEKSGFGIGLSIARSICEAHKGEIEAKSPDGKTVEFIAKLK